MSKVTPFKESEAPPLYSPGPGAYAEPAAPGPSMVVIAHSSVPENGVTCVYRDVPCLVVCQHCRATVITTMTSSVGTYTFFICGIFVLLGLYIGCCLIPFFVDGCKDVIHSCPNCRATVGRYRRWIGDHVYSTKI